MSKHTDTSLFMFSPSSKYAGFYQELLRGLGSYQQLGNKLVHLAEQASAFRQDNTVRELGRVLSNFPIKQYQPIGHYYLATLLSKPGESDLDKARSIFELVVDTAPPMYRAKAIHSLAAVSAYRKDPDSELYFLVETLRASCDIATTVEVLRGIAVHKAKAGDHKHALKDLERIFPLIKYVPPYFYFAYLNSLAVELGEVGRKYEARNVIKPVLESPFIIAYPEWRETADEVKGPNRSFAVLNPTRRRRKGKLLTMPVIEYAEPTQWHKPAPVINLEKWKAKMSDKGDELDGRELLLKVVELSTHPGMTDAKLLQVIQLMYRLLIEAPKPDDDGEDESGA